MKQISKKDLFIYLAALITILIVVFSAYLYVMSLQIQDIKKDFILNRTETNYSKTKLEFCYNQSIKPCSDAAVSAWNDENPNDTFQLKSYRDLVEDGIRQYNETRL